MSHFILKTLVKIGVYEFDAVNSITIDESNTNLSDKCTIVIAQKLKFEGQSLAELIKVGDVVQVYANYEPYDLLRFEGYVTEINIDNPVTISCEDGGWLLKQKNLEDKTFDNATLEDVVKYTIPEFDYVISQKRNLGQFILENNPTAAQVFEELKKTYKVYTYFRDGVYYIGYNYGETLPPPKKFNFEKQIISDNLLYKDEKAVKLGVKVKSINARTNVKTEVFVGDSDGDIVTLFDPSGTDDLNDLKEFGEKELEKFKFTGFTGGFKTFLHPRVRHSHTVELESSKQPERNGEYFVKRVQTSFGINGGRQDITLDKKVI